MPSIENKLESLGLVLPEPVKLPPDVVLPFAWVRVHGDRAYASGHVALAPDGSIAEPRGKIGAELSQDEGYASARLTALAMLSSLKRELGELDRIQSWLRVFGMVNTAPGFDRYPLVINGFSDLIIEFWGPGCPSGRRWRSRPRC